MLIAQVGLSLPQIAIYVVVALAVCAIVYIAAKRMGVPVPDWLVQIVVVVIVAAVAILAIKVVAGL